MLTNNSNGFRKSLHQVVKKRKASCIIGKDCFFKVQGDVAMYYGLLCILEDKENDKSLRTR